MNLQHGMLKIKFAFQSRQHLIVAVDFGFYGNFETNRALLAGGKSFHDVASA